MRAGRDSIWAAGQVRVAAVGVRLSADARPAMRALVVGLALVVAGQLSAARQQIQMHASNSNTNAGEKPRVIPLAAAESGYAENSSVNILCTVSAGHHETLAFDWFRDGALLAADQSLPPTAAAGNATGGGVRIEHASDHSLLRIARVRPSHSGAKFTCVAKNAFGSDSSTATLVVNGESLVAQLRARRRSR